MGFADSYALRTMIKDVLFGLMSEGNYCRFDILIKWLATVMRGELNTSALCVFTPEFMKFFRYHVYPKPATLLHNIDDFDRDNCLIFTIIKLNMVTPTIYKNTLDRIEELISYKVHTNFVVCVDNSNTSGYEIHPDLGPEFREFLMMHASMHTLLRSPTLITHEMLLGYLDLVKSAVVGTDFDEFCATKPLSKVLLYHTLMYASDSLAIDYNKIVLRSS